LLKFKYLFIIVLFSISLFIAYQILSIKEINSNTFITPKEINNTYSMQSVSFESISFLSEERRNSIKLNKKYIPVCEIEIANKYISTEKGKECMNSYIHKTNNSKTLEDIYLAEDNLLNCLKESDKNALFPMSVNIHGIDLLIYEWPTKHFLCKQQKELFNSYIINTLLIFSPFIIIFLILGIYYFFRVIKRIKNEI